MAYFDQVYAFLDFLSDTVNNSFTQTPINVANCRYSLKYFGLND